MCCGTPTPLYGTTTLTSSYTTITPVTTTIPPYASYSTFTSTVCVSSTTTKLVAIYDHFFPETRTTAVTKVVPVTTTKTYNTATLSTPCPIRRDGESVENFEKRGPGSSTINVGSKLGIAIIALLLSSNLIA